MAHLLEVRQEMSPCHLQPKLGHFLSLGKKDTKRYFSCHLALCVLKSSIKAQPCEDNIFSLVGGPVRRSLVEMGLHEAQ